MHEQEEAQQEKGSTNTLSLTHTGIHTVTYAILNKLMNSTASVEEEE